MQTVKAKQPKKEQENIEYGLERELRQANFTKRKRDKMQCLKDFLRDDCGEDLRDYSPKRLQDMLDSGFMD